MRHDKILVELKLGDTSLGKANVYLKKNTSSATKIREDLRSNFFFVLPFSPWALQRLVGNSAFAGGSVSSLPSASSPQRDFALKRSKEKLELDLIW